MKIQIIDEATLELGDNKGNSEIIEKRCVRLLLRLSELQVEHAHFVSRPELPVMEQIKKNRPLQGDIDAKWSFLCHVQGKGKLGDLTNPDAIQSIKVFSDKQIEQEIDYSIPFGVDLYAYNYTDENSSIGIISHNPERELENQISISITIPLSVLYTVSENIIRYKPTALEIVTEVLVFEDGLSVYIKRDEMTKIQINSISYALLQ